MPERPARPAFKKRDAATPPPRVVDRGDKPASETKGKTFYAFGTAENSTWYRISVGTCKIEEIDEMLAKLRSALSQLA